MCGEWFLVQETVLRILFGGLWGLFPQATQYIRQSPERGGEDTVVVKGISLKPGRLSGKLSKPFEPRGTEDFGRTGSAPYVGAFPGRDCLLRGRQLFPGRVLIMYIGQLCFDNPA